jgi:hypothetical protein
LEKIINIKLRMYTGEVVALQAVSTDTMKSGKEHFKKQNVSAE